MGPGNEDGVEDGTPGEGEAEEFLPKAGAKRKSGLGKKPGSAKLRKRVRPNPKAPSSGIGTTSNDTPSVPPFPTFDARQDYSHLPPPTLPGGVPIVSYSSDALVRHDDQPAASATATGDDVIQSAATLDGADQDAQVAYTQHSPHSLPSTHATSSALSQPQSYPGQWPQVPQPQQPVPGQPFPPHSHVPPQAIGAPSYVYSAPPTALNTMPPSHVSAGHTVHPYPHVQIPPRPTEYTQPPSSSTHPMRPLQFPPGGVPSPQPFITSSQTGLDYRQHSHSHSQQSQLTHSHQRVSSFGQPAQPPQGYAPYGAYQAQASYPQSHSGYSMSPVGMGGPPPLTSPTTHEDISTPTSSRSGALPSSGLYISLPPAALESAYRPPPPAHTHGGNGGPAPPEAAIQGYGYTSQEQTGYEGYCTSRI